MSSLKERGRVKRGFYRSFVRVSAFGGMPDWPAGMVRRPGARGVPCYPAAAGPGERTGGSRTGRSPAGIAGAARRPGRSRLRADNRAAGDRRACGCGGCGPHGQLWCWRAWLRSSLRVARGMAPRGMGLVRAGSGINQMPRPRRRGGGQTRKRSRAARGRACSSGLVLRAGGVQCPDVPVAHRVEDVGEQLAGRGDLGDGACLGAAAGDDGLPGPADRGAGRVRWTASTSAQRSAGEPCLVIRPRITVVSDS